MNIFTTKKKRIEYQNEYESTRKAGKTIPELIKEFDSDTDSLYGQGKKSIQHSKAINAEIPDFLNKVTDRVFFLRDKEIVHDGRVLSTLGEIRNHPEFSALKDLFDSKHDNVEVRIIPEEKLSSDYDAYFEPDTKTIYVDRNVTPEIIVHEYTHLLDFEINKFDLLHKLEYYFYNTVGKTRQELLDDIIEGIAITNENIAKERMNDNYDINFERPSRTTATILRRLFKGEIKIGDFIRRCKTFARRRKTFRSRQEETSRSKITHTNGKTQKKAGIGLSGLRKLENEATDIPTKETVKNNTKISASDNTPQKIAKDEVRDWYAGIEIDRLDVNKHIIYPNNSFLILIGL